MLRWNYCADQSHSTSGKTLDGRVLSSEHRVAFAKALRMRFAPPVERSVTPPPDLPAPSNLTGEAYFEGLLFH